MLSLHRTYRIIHRLHLMGIKSSWMIELEKKGESISSTATLNPLKKQKWMTLMIAAVHCESCGKPRSWYSYSCRFYIFKPGFSCLSHSSGCSWAVLSCRGANVIKCWHPREGRLGRSVKVFGQMVCISWPSRECQDPGFLSRIRRCKTVVTHFSFHWFWYGWWV